MTSGGDLSQRFFERTARPIIDNVLSGAGYVAGRLGSGSDVLGLDDRRSRDHDFGCRLTVLVDDEHRSMLDALGGELEARLPEDVNGWPTRFATTWDGAIGHRVDVHTVNDFTATRLGFDLRSPLGAAQWLCLTGQSVLEVTAGPVFHDSTRSYANVCRTLRWYPDDLWHHVLAAGWSRLGRELPLVGRTGEVDDEAGSRIIASRLCRDIGHLAFLVERTWMPYPKWQGTVLRRLPSGPALAAALVAVQASTGWTMRQRRLEEAIEILVERHRATGFDLPAPVVHPFFDRPFLTVGEQIPLFFMDRVADEGVRALPPIGSIEQWCDNVDLLTRPARRAEALPLYQTAG